MIKNIIYNLIKQNQYETAIDYTQRSVAANFV
jgi:hypothetical protein